MGCPFEEKLTSWLLGDLSPKEQNEVTCHVFTCASCRQECDELRKVLFPLRSGLHKDQGLFKPKKHISWTQWLYTSSWIGRAALLIFSASMVVAIMALYHHELSQRGERGDEPVTHITFVKQVEPPKLEPLALPAKKEPDLLADLSVGVAADLELEKYVLVPPPVIPGAHWTPHFMTLNQLAMLKLLPGSKESVHERLMRELPDAKWLHEGPVRNPKTRRLSPLVQPEVIFYAAPVYAAPTNQVQGTQSQKGQKKK